METREMKVSLWHALRARIVGVALCAVAVSATCAEVDKVTLVKNKDVRQGRITKDDRDGLEIELTTGKGIGGARQTFTSADIADVDWDITTEGYHDAITAFHAGAYTRAAENLQSIIDQKDVLDQVRPVARPYLFYLFAECKYRGGKTAEAIAAYQKLLTTFPNSRYGAFAITNMAESAIQAKTFDKLAPLLASLREGGNDQKQLADYYEGESLLAQNKPADALKKYTNAAAGSAARIKAMALVGQARCYMAANDAGKARDAAKSALDLSPSETVAASAHSLIGDAILAEADAKKLAGTPLQDALFDAILEFMRVQNQYPTDARTEGYAVLRAAECFKRLSKLPGRAGSDDQGRAVQLFGRLSSDRRFANTEYPNQAFKQLDEMK